MSFLPIEKLINLYDGYRKVIKHNALEVLILQHEGQLYVLQNRCPHQEQPLHTAEVQGSVIFCSRHQYGFDLTTGKQLESACAALKLYPPIFEGAVVGIEVDSD